MKDKTPRSLQPCDWQQEQEFKIATLVEARNMLGAEGGTEPPMDALLGIADPLFLKRRIAAKCCLGHLIRCLALD